MNEYKKARENNGGFFEQKRGIIRVSGGEAEMFLNGLMTNDVKKLPENAWMIAAFPNAQGRLLALVRVWRKDGKFYFDTEIETYETVLKNLQRFTLAGDFFVDDLTGDSSIVSVRGSEIKNLKFKTPGENEVLEAEINDEKIFVFRAFRAGGFDVFLPKTSKENFFKELQNAEIRLIGEKTKDIFRIENGIPKYGVDMDETTVVLETGIDEAVSFNKGCYIGQEIIARIHFRGHVAKKLTGLIFEDETAEIKSNDELKSADGKNAGRITSAIFSPTLNKIIALAYVRYDYLAEGTELKVNDLIARVKDLPFVH